MGVGVGPGVGVGVGAGVGVAPAPGSGATPSCATDDAESVTCGPTICASTGVRSVKWPATVTVTVSPRAGVVGHGLGEHASVTSAAVISYIEPLASLSTRHRTRFVSLSHGFVLSNEVGLRAASRAPSLAAFSIVIWL